MLSLHIVLTQPEIRPMNEKSAVAINMASNRVSGSRPK